MNAAFARLHDALRHPPAGTKKLAVAFSGGLDSTALLHALVESAPALPVRAIHVCHHLQADAEAWVVTCARQAAVLGVGFTRVDVDVHTQGQSLEAAARHARYSALEEALSEGEILITAHHARDQAETFLLQALRGAGPHGLAAMPHWNALGKRVHWRPWLTVDYPTICAYAREREIRWIDDPSNKDPDIARSFLREAVMPELRSRWPQADAVLSRSAAHASEAAQAIDALAQIDLEGALESDGTLICDALMALSPARAKQVVRLWLAHTGRDTPDHRHVAAIVELGASRLAASPCVSFANSEVRLFAGRLHAMARLAALPAHFVQEWSGCEPLALPVDCGVLAMDPPPREALRLKVAFRQGGERAASAQGGRRQVKDLLREARVPPWQRQRIPLVYYGETLVAIADIWRHPHIEQLLYADIGRFIWHDRPA